MNIKANIDLQKIKSESQDIYQTLCNSRSMYEKCLKLEREKLTECLNNAVGVLITDDISINTGSAGEGTNIILQDYGKRLWHSSIPCYVSDVDIMEAWCNVRVSDERDTLLQTSENEMHCQAEHTTDGFRKIRVIYNPQFDSTRQYKAKKLASLDVINMSTEHGYLSSSTFLATLSQMDENNIAPVPVYLGRGTEGPSQTIKKDGIAADLVKCFYVKTWPKEADSWFTRQAHWPDRILRSKIRNKGYLLVPTGNRNTEESDLEWRCSFSIAEKILFQSMTTFQRCTFVLLKVLLKEYLPSDINTDGEKQFLSTYHMKTVFLWSLEDSKLKWEPKHMLDIIHHIFDKLLWWINQKFFPHYFIPSVNLFDGRQLAGRSKSLICFISDIRNDLSNKIKQSQFFMGQEINWAVASNLMLDDHIRQLLCIPVHIHHYVIKCIMGRLLTTMHDNIMEKDLFLKQLNLRLSMLIEGLVKIEHDIDPQSSYLYRCMYSDPVHDKLLTEVLPGLMNQYRGCIHLAKYCIAARDGRILPDVLHTAETLLKDTLNLDPCSGHVKLACLYMATGDFVQAMETLDIGESHFLLTHNKMVTSAFTASQCKGVDINTITKEIYTFVFQKWAEGQVTSDIVVTWPEYITAPYLLQFEMIQERTQFIDLHHPSKMVALVVHLKYPPLSIIKLLKFVCAFSWGQSSTSYLENLVEDLIYSNISITVLPAVNDTYPVFNMAAWCYLKIQKYKPAARMMTEAIRRTSQTKSMKIPGCTFSHHFLAYVLAQCVALDSRVLVYERDTTEPEWKITLGYVYLDI